MIYKLFLDSDVVIDFFTDRAPFSSSASELFELNEQGVVTLFLSAVSINNIYYIVRKFLGHKKSIEVITLLTEITEVIGTTKKEIVQALKNEFDDFEDSIQFSYALTIENVDAIITRNIKDYRNSTVVVMTPLEFLKMIDENSNKL